MSIQPINKQSGTHPLILVTAATAPVGHSIVEQLVAMGHPVRVLTRDPSKVSLPAGIEVVAGDLSDAESLAVAFQDVSAVFLLARRAWLCAYLSQGGQRSRSTPDRVPVLGSRSR